MFFNLVSFLRNHCISVFFLFFFLWRNFWPHCCITFIFHFTMFVSRTGFISLGGTASEIHGARPRRHQWHRGETIRRCRIVKFKKDRERRGAARENEGRRRKMRKLTPGCVPCWQDGWRADDGWHIEGQRSEWVTALTDSRGRTERCRCGSARTERWLLPLITLNYSSQRWIQIELHNRSRPMKYWRSRRSGPAFVQQHRRSASPPKWDAVQSKNHWSRTVEALL